jgi:hypothetical protein
MKWWGPKSYSVEKLDCFLKPAAPDLSAFSLSDLGSPVFDFFYPPQPVNRRGKFEDRHVGVCEAANEFASTAATELPVGMDFRIGLRRFKNAVSCSIAYAASYGKREKAVFG